MQKIFFVIVFIISGTAVLAQQKTDTVIVELAKTSKMIFTIQDKKDLEILKHYNFQQLFNDILNRLEHPDSTNISQTDSVKTELNVSNNEIEDDEEDQEANENIEDTHKYRREHHEHNERWRWHRDRNHWGNTWQSFNFDLGMNNYIDNGNSAANSSANYVVRPWGSWYVAVNSVQRTRLAKAFFLEWGLGMSWYNFKFENENTWINKTADQVIFQPDPRDFDFIKSKLTVSYVNVSLIPVIDFSDDNTKPRLWDGGNSFRIGLGPYAGYRIGSHSKQEYKEDGDRDRDKNRDNFYLNNLRYGARLQIGFRSTDLFFNYDMNKLFTEGKGPDLNAFSFGVVF
jgi:hypothetical protein